jgi:hypothetical protein
MPEGLPAPAAASETATTRAESSAVLLTDEHCAR